METFIVGTCNAASDIVMSFPSYFVVFVGVVGVFVVVVVVVGVVVGVVAMEMRKRCCCCCSVCGCSSFVGDSLASSKNTFAEMFLSSDLPHPQ